MYWRAGCGVTANGAPGCLEYGQAIAGYYQTAQRAEVVGAFTAMQLCPVAMSYRTDNMFTLDGGLGLMAGLEPGWRWEHRDLWTGMWGLHQQRAHDCQADFQRVKGHITQVQVDEGKQEARGDGLPEAGRAGQQ